MKVKRVVAGASVALVATLVPTAAGAANHDWGDCHWQGSANVGLGKSIANDLGHTGNDCVQVQARVLVYVGPGTQYVNGPVDDNYSEAQTFWGYLSGSTRGNNAQAGFGWSTWRPH
jgi:hypothetical protein